MSKIEELERKLEQRREARAKAEAEQYEKDLEARLELEDAHGPLAAVKPAVHIAGQPTRAFARTPSPSEYKRYKDQIHRAINAKNVKGQQDASEMLARACWVYPKSEEERDSMLGAYPGLLTQISIAATSLAEGKAEHEGKD